MLPQVVNEDSVRIFRFLFNQDLRDGIHYCQELYYRVQSVDNSLRPRLYQQACRLSDQGADVLITVSFETCSLWISLRNQRLAALTLQPQAKLPSLTHLIEGCES